MEDFFEIHTAGLVVVTVLSGMAGILIAVLCWVLGVQQ